MLCRSFTGHDGSQDVIQGLDGLVLPPKVLLYFLVLYVAEGLSLDLLLLSVEVALLEDLVKLTGLKSTDHHLGLDARLKVVDVFILLLAQVMELLTFHNHVYFWETKMLHLLDHDV